MVEGFLANLFMKGGLSNNHIDPNARLCMASAVTGFLATFGVDEPAGCYDDFDHCDVAIMWGNNPAEMHPVLWSRLTDRRLRGEKVEIIDIGTRRTRTTELRRPLPANFARTTDLAIANWRSCMTCCLANGTWNQRLRRAKHCNPSATTHPRQIPQRRAARLRGATAPPSQALYTRSATFQNSPACPRMKIRLLGRPLRQPRPPHHQSSWCMGMNQHTRGTAINCLVHGLHLLSGHWGRPGDNAFSLTGQPSACGTAREVGTLCHTLPGGMVVAKPEHRAKAEELWNLPAGRIAAKPGFHTVQMWEEFCKPDGGISTVWVQVTNPGQSLPNLGKLFDGASRQDGKFLIVSDVYPTATTRMADLVLPSARWVEKNGIYGNSERRTHQWFRMIAPPGQARDDAWQILAVARRLHDQGHPGMRDRDGRFLFHVADAVGKEVPIWDWMHWHDVNADHIFFERYRPFTRIKHKDLAPYEQYVDSRGLRWPVVQQADGTWRETRYRFVAGEDPYVAAGKDFDFYHGNDGDGKAYVWFHPYAAPAESPDAEYPFLLSTGRVLEHWHTGSMTMRIPQLSRAMPHAYIEIHPADATRLGIQSGQRVVVESRRGAIELPAWIDGRGAPPQGTVFIPFFDERLLVNQITLDAHDPFSKEPDYKKSAVRLRKAV